MNVGSHLAKRAELNPGLEALVDDAAGRRFTYAELERPGRPRRPRADRTRAGQGRPRRRAAAELPPVRRALLRRGPRRVGRRPAQLAAGRRRAGVHPARLRGDGARGGRRVRCRRRRAPRPHRRRRHAGARVAARRRRTVRRGRSTTTPSSTAASDEPDRRRRRRRRPAVHHVHLWHHRTAERGVAHPRQRRVGRAHGAGDRRRALPGPLPDLSPAVPRRGAQPTHRHHLPRRHGDPHAPVRPGADLDRSSATSR